MARSRPPEPATTPHRKQIFGKKWFYAGVVGIAAGLSAFVTYAWQHQQLMAQTAKVSQLTAGLNSANHKVSFLTVQQTGLNQQIDGLNATNNQLSSELDAKSKTATPSPTPSAPPPLPALTVTVTGGQKYSPPGSPSSTKIVADVSLTNSTAKSIVLPISSFTMKDELNNTSADFGELAGTTMPNGAVVMTDQTIAPGQSVSGALLFDTLDPNFLNYTIYYDGQPYPFTAK